MFEHKSKMAKKLRKELFMVESKIDFFLRNPRKFFLSRSRFNFLINRRNEIKSKLKKN